MAIAVIVDILQRDRGVIVTLLDRDGRNRPIALVVVAVPKRDLSVLFARVDRASLIVDELESAKVIPFWLVCDVAARTALSPSPSRWSDGARAQIARGIGLR